MRLIHRSHHFTPLFALCLCGLFAVMGCSDDSPTGSNNNANSTPQTITSDYYIQAKVNGQYYTLQEETISPTNATGMGYRAHEATRTDDFLSVHETYFSRIKATGGIPVLDTNQTFFLTFIGLFDERPNSDDDYDLMIKSGSWKFGSEIEEKEGIEIRWRDKNGKAWSTAYGSGDQTGSSFTITTRKKIEYPQPWLGPYMLYFLKGTFNCTLYDESGNSMPVTDGKFAVNAVVR